MSNISITLNLNIINLLIIILIGGFIISNTCISCINKEGMSNLLYSTSNGVHNDKYQKVYEPGENYEKVRDDFKQTYNKRYPTFGFAKLEHSDLISNFVELL